MTAVKKQAPIKIYPGQLGTPSDTEAFVFYMMERHGGDEADYRQWAAEKAAQDHDGTTNTIRGNPRPAEETTGPWQSHRPLDVAHRVFRKWLGSEYDFDALNATLAAAASERLDGDPLWLLIISGSGAAKTETICALKGSDAHIVSTIASEGALLSASHASKNKLKSATGGLLPKMGGRGVMVIKDMGSILSAAHESRGTVLAALREIYDGIWSRYVGLDGGQTLEWRGRIVVVAAATSAWDMHYGVVASLGDRFVLLRIDSSVGRIEAGEKAIANTGNEVTMRQELADAAGGVIASACTDNVAISKEETTELITIADLVTMARTAVERDKIGEVIDAYQPEMPTRFAKQLSQLVRGGVAIGMERDQAMRLALRCARDSMPPLRRSILLDVLDHPQARPGEVRQRLNKPWKTVKREMEALTYLDLLHCVEETEEAAVNDEGKSEGKDKKVWLYSIKRERHKATLRAMKPEDVF
jgi:hypothetical protein